MEESNEKLIRLIKGNKDVSENMEKLYKRNGGFIHWVVKNRVYGIYDIDDLFQESYIALVKAVELFDETRDDVSFLTLFKWCIMNRIRRMDGSIPAHLKTLVAKYLKIRNNIIKDLGYEPSDDEIMEAMGIDYKKLISIKQNSYICTSLDKYLYDDEKATVQDILADDTAHLLAQNNLEAEDIKNKVRDNLSVLPYEMQDILNYRYTDEKTYEDIAKEKGISSLQVLNIEKKALKVLRQNKRFFNDVYDYVRNDDINFYARRSAEDIALQKISIDFNNNQLSKKVNESDIVVVKLNSKIRIIDKVNKAFYKYAMMGKPINIREHTIVQTLDENEFEDILAVEKIYNSSKMLVREILEIVYFDEPLECLTKEEFLFRVNKASFLTNKPILVINYILKDIKKEFAKEIGEFYE